MATKTKKNICKTEIRQNIINVDTGQPLTMPLSVLNKNCEFKNHWDKFCKKVYGEDDKKLCYKKYRKAYRQRPKVKARRRAYQKTYYQIPKVKAYQKAYQKAHRQRPEVKTYHKTYQKAYYQIPKVKAHIKTHQKAYRQRPEVKAHIKAYMKAYNQRIKKQNDKKKQITAKYSS